MHEKEREEKERKKTGDEGDYMGRKSWTSGGDHLFFPCVVNQSGGIVEWWMVDLLSDKTDEIKYIHHLNHSLRML